MEKPKGRPRQFDWRGFGIAISAITILLALAVAAGYILWANTEVCLQQESEILPTWQSGFYVPATDKFIDGMKMHVDEKSRICFKQGDQATLPAGEQIRVPLEWGTFRENLKGVFFMPKTGGQEVPIPNEEASKFVSRRLGDNLRVYVPVETLKKIQPQQAK